MFIDKRNGNTEGWINYTGSCIPTYEMSIVLKNNIKSLFKDEDEFLTFAEYIEPSVRLSFKENKFNENTPDTDILNQVLIQHIPVIFTSLNPLSYKLNIFYQKLSSNRHGNLN